MDEARETANSSSAAAEAKHVDPVAGLPAMHDEGVGLHHVPLHTVPEGQSEELRCTTPDAGKRPGRSFSSDPRVVEPKLGGRLPSHRMKTNDVGVALGFGLITSPVAEYHEILRHQFSPRRSLRMQSS